MQYFIDTDNREPVMSINYYLSLHIFLYTGFSGS